MKRGVFMLLLDFVDERELLKKQKRKIFRKKESEKNSVIKRDSINVNGKNVTILELSERDLEKEDVLTLLKIYKGKVLVSEKFKKKDLLKEYLYSPEKYYQRALLSSLINQVKTVNREWKFVVVKISGFSPFKEFYELVRISKSVIIITETNSSIEKFLNDCYYEYGAIVSIKKENISIKNDVYLDLDIFDSNGKLMINAKGKEFLLYPDIRYFENCSEYQKLAPYNIEYNIICSAFSNK